MNIPTPIIAAALFVVTFIGSVVVYVSQGSLPGALLSMDTLLLGAAIGGAVPNVGEPKP